MRSLREFGLSLPVDDGAEFAPGPLADHGEGFAIPELRQEPRVSGLLVSYDLRWLWLQSFAQQVGPKEFDRFDQYLRPFNTPPSQPPVADPIDDSWTCRSWLRWNGGEKVSPFVIRRLHRGIDRSRGIRLIRSTLQPRYEILRVNGQNVRVIDQQARPARLHRASIAPAWQRPGDLGSAGGMLEVPGIGACTTTAGHVAPEVGKPVYTRTGGQATTLGECVHAPDYSVEGLLDESSVIKLASPDGWQRPATSVVLMGPDDVGVGKPLEMAGARSHHTDTYPEHYFRYQELSDRERHVRIDDGFVLRRKRDGIFGTTSLRASVPGDSGAWVLRRYSDGTAGWAGSLVGGDAVLSYATFAKHTVDAITAAFGAPTLL